MFPSDLAASWDTCVRCNCLQHGLTVHSTYEVISPYPKFRAVVCMNYSNHVVLNTGNFLHVLRVDLNNLKSKHQRGDDRQDPGLSEIAPLDVIDVVESEDTKLPSYMNLGMMAEGHSPKCDSVIECDFSDEAEASLNTSSSNQSDYVCDNSKFSVNPCLCPESVSCQCGIPLVTQAISVRDKILQDFCEDMTQELSIGSDLITLVKHPPCSPRSTPQRLPLDPKPMTWPSPILTPPSDILKTRNSESSHRNARLQRVNSPQPGASHDALSITSINSPLHTLSIGTISSGSSRLMSPPVTRTFRNVNPRKHTSLNSPPPNLSNSQPRTRATHKLILEAEKAYEFTDEAQETCEKLSSFRKRRLADKKYEFCDETEDAENIVPFKHVRDQFKHKGCAVYQVSPAASPLPNGRRHRIDSDHSEGDELGQDSAMFGDMQILDGG